MKIGDEVETEHGTGIIIGKDLPLSRVWRWVVKITTPKEDRNIHRQFCYNEKEIVLKKTD